MVLTVGAAVAIALWVVHTYALDAAQITPRLLIRSAEKQSGKTTLMFALQHLVRVPHPVSNITGAGIFRMIAAMHPTLLMDEADTYVRNSDDIASILNSGHNRAMARVTRCVPVKGNYVPKVFPTWCPVAIAGIGRQRDTLEDRSISIVLRRKLPTEKVERLRLDRMNEFTAIQGKLETWRNQNIVPLTKQNRDPSVPDELSDRAADNWRALFAIADYAGGDWPERSRRAAKVLTPSRADDESTGTQLLGDVRAVFATAKLDRISSQHLAHELAELEDRPWREWNKGRPMTPYQVSKRIKAFDIAPKVIRIGSQTPRGYQRDWFDDAFARYLPAESATPQQSSVSAASDSSESATETATIETAGTTSATDVAGCAVPVAGDVAGCEDETPSTINAVAGVAEYGGDRAKGNGAAAPTFDPTAILNAEQDDRPGGRSRVDRRRHRSGGRPSPANDPEAGHAD
jgi:hypothetical protein